MNDDERRRLYLNQIRVTGQVILSRQDSEWFLAQLNAQQSCGRQATLADPHCGAKMIMLTGACIRPAWHRTTLVGASEEA